MNVQSPVPVIMVADITGSASLHHRLDAQEAERAVDRCIKRMTRSIEGYQGKLLQSAGDELLVIFPSAELACQSAIDMHQRVADLPPVSGHKLGIRVALHDSNDDTDPSSVKRSSLMRIAALANTDQILCSGAVVEALNTNGGLPVKTRLESTPLQELDAALPLFQVQWAPTHTTPSAPAVDTASSGNSGKFCLRYRGKAYLIDERHASLSLGRDPSCSLTIPNRKVSRAHARIERRPDGFFLIDTSSNGSFLSMQGRQEILLRKREIRLEGSGILCLGTSINDPAADRLEFEHL